MLGNDLTYREWLKVAQDCGQSYDVMLATAASRDLLLLSLKLLFLQSQ
jgi:hypothetical protein